MKKVLAVIFLTCSLIFVGRVFAVENINTGVQVVPTTVAPTTVIPTTVTPTPLPAPTISLVDVVVSGGLRQITVIGSGFVTGASIVLDGTTYSAVLLDAAHLQLSLSSLSNGGHTLRIVNPDTQYIETTFSYLNPTPTPTPTVTATPTATVEPTKNPTITLVDVRPNIDGDLELWVIGDEFQEGAEIVINDVKYPAVFVDKEHIKIELPGNLTGEVTIEVVNIDGTKTDNPFKFIIPISTPTVTVTNTVTPSNSNSDNNNTFQIYTINEESDGIIITGKGFNKSLGVSINGIKYSFKYVDENHIKVMGTEALQGAMSVRLTSSNGIIAEKVFNFNGGFVLDMLSITKAVQNIAETSQVGTVAASGVATAIAVTSMFDYLKVAFIPWRKRKKYWGLVLDNAKMAPIPLAVINAIDINTNKVVAEAVSDMDGRYGIVLDPGDYRLDVKHYAYTLSQQEMYGAYFGQVINVKSVSSLNFNIYMLQHADSKAPFVYQLKITWNKFNELFTKVYPYLLAIFLAINLYFMIVTWQLVYICLVAYHVFLFIVFFLYVGKYRNLWATCVDSVSGLPIPHALVKLYKVGENELVDTKITDDQGRFQFIVPKGQYQFIAAVAGYTFPSQRNNVAQDAEGRVVLDYNQTLSVDEIPLDRSGMIPAPTPGAAKFGVIS